MHACDVDGLFVCFFALYKLMLIHCTGTSSLAEIFLRLFCYDLCF